MQHIVAAIIDALAAVLAVYLAFRLGLLLTPCSQLSDCFPLTPIVVLLALLALGAYFGVARLIWGTTAGRKVTGVDDDATI
jgi:hypothetical protein